MANNDLFQRKPAKPPPLAPKPQKKGIGDYLLVHVLLDTVSGTTLALMGSKALEFSVALATKLNVVPGIMNIILAVLVLAANSLVALLLWVILPFGKEEPAIPEKKDVDSKP